MKISSVFQTARSITIEIEDGGIYETVREYQIESNGEYYGKTRRVITSLYGLLPDTDYRIRVWAGEEEAFLTVRTEGEFVTLDVRDFGALGDGVRDDTAALQAAILACPKEGRVLVPAGVYRTGSLFLKDDLRLELAEGAVLSAWTERERFPILPGKIPAYDGEREYCLGTWEGDPLPMYAAILTGIGVRHVVIYGQGVIDGNAGYDNWWKDAKVMRGAWRPRMIFLNRCEDVTVQGIRIQNSPSWNIHPYFSRNLRFLDLSVKSPKDSPNTDGLDPESCRHVEILGVRFSVGDDCIAVKSGKIYMGARYKTPCEDVVVRHCRMKDGHGSVTIGSEMAGGVRNLTVRDCLFLHTDRGLRIKTRRGRGKDAVVDGILFENIRMDQVLSPFVLNSFYCCDPDGCSEYVRCKEPLPVDERTPEIRSLVFRDIEAVNCHVAAAYFYGLPEKKIREIVLERVRITFAEDAEAGIPAMLEGAKPRRKMGIYARNIRHLVMRDVTVEGQEGEAFLPQGIDELEME